ncbi:hypothetical protein F5I97DRAFT_1831599 [Phlebopus sp. FC_14]|nr:hypothetical protein F5I97DRAFT_1831599 [Phlebopus sp. FC_14]
MFSRISFTISRVLRFRGRRANKTQTRSSPAFETVSVPPPLPPKDHPTTKRPNARAETVPDLDSHTLLSPIAQSPTGVASPPLSPIEGAHTPIIVISLDNAEPRVISEKSSLSTLVGVDTTFLSVEDPFLNDKHASFSPHKINDTNGPSSRPSTLPQRTKSKRKSRAKPTPPPLPIFLTDTGAPRGWEDIPCDLDSAHIKPNGSKRPISLFSPRPTATTTYTSRTKSLRFSVSAKPRAPRPRGAGVVPKDTSESSGEALGAAHKRRMSKRASAVPAPGAPVKERRKSRWDQEMDLPETQEVLRALRDMN